MPFEFANEEPLSRVKVYVRLRPVQKPSPMIHVDDETGTVIVDVLKSSGGGPPRSTIEQSAFTVDDIIRTTNQQRAFEHCAKEYTDEFLNGYNATIMAFGQVGAGKTYTMAGDTKIHVHRGFIQRAIGQVMEEKRAHPEAGIVVYMSYLEIYEEAIKWFNEGEKQRSYGQHLLNQQSSRSHTFFTLYMERRVGRFHTEHDTIVAKLTLVDLAGAERLKKTNVERGGRMRKEACTINKSISYLETAIYALRVGQNYVPFRQGKASTLLKESLGGNCKTMIMICLWLEDCFYDETVNSLRFAQKVKFLKTYPFRNKKLDCATATKRRHLQQIANLQQEVALKDALQGRPGLSFDDLT
ncbi:hypothetical protein KC19_1G215900 [Ceratodon purpureus]|uniref:Kinesin-like protein n=1 Tax=Ceratodon purpureus TaxID=3225 RepID=A0A8T0JB98_CERPU|nr:hypothetical protein KC19_1G215900 [Ceratodon purpureus]